MIAKPDAQPAPVSVQATEAAEHVYAMSPQGKRQALVLLAGVASIWVFALWTLVTILQDGVGGVEWVSLLLMLGILVVGPIVAWALLEEANCRIETSDGGLTYRTVAGITLTYPWAAITGLKPKGGKSRMARFFLGDDDSNGTSEQESFANVTPAEELITNTRSTEAQTSPAQAGDTETGEEEEPETVLLAVLKEGDAHGMNPIVRFLHNQAHGGALPIYGGLVNREELLREIKQRVGNS